MSTIAPMCCCPSRWKRMISSSRFRNSGLKCARTISITCGSASRSEEHTSELQSLMRISYAVFCLKKKTSNHTNTYNDADDNRTNRTTGHRHDNGTDTYTN